MIATILSLNGGLLTTILCIDNQYLVTINSQIKLSVCLSVCLSVHFHKYTLISGGGTVKAILNALIESFERSFLLLPHSARNEATIRK